MCAELCFSTMPSGLMVASTAWRPPAGEAGEAAAGASDAVDMGLSRPALAGAVGAASGAIAWRRPAPAALGSSRAHRPRLGGCSCPAGALWHPFATREVACAYRAPLAQAASGGGSPRATAWPARSRCRNARSRQLSKSSVDNCFLTSNTSSSFCGGVDRANPAEIGNLSLWLRAPEARGSTPVATRHSADDACAEELPPHPEKWLG
mmetsp:Transcript_37869/g.121846  ORF Transcript_37869/g.121846 Transcript_37869/m.121846 type:complete len:207 (-) Transcript_37869:200-820(-)